MYDKFQTEAQTSKSWVSNSLLHNFNFRRIGESTFLKLPRGQTARISTDIHSSHAKGSKSSMMPVQSWLAVRFVTLQVF
jgi:hypothetical protein